MGKPAAQSLGQGYKVSGPQGRARGLRARGQRVSLLTVRGLHNARALAIMAHRPPLIGRVNSLWLEGEPPALWCLLYKAVASLGVSTPRCKGGPSLPPGACFGLSFLLACQVEPPSRSRWSELNWDSDT